MGKKILIAKDAKLLHLRELLASIYLLMQQRTELCPIITLPPCISLVFCTENLFDTGDLITY